MKFDLYRPFTNKSGKVCPGVTATSVTFGEIMDEMQSSNMEQLITSLRAGDQSKKMWLPAVDWMGKATRGKRLKEQMAPTQYVMVDIDYCKDPRGSFASIYERMRAENEPLGFAHVTCRGEGLRLVLRARGETSMTMPEYLHMLGEKYHFGEFGDFDEQCSDLSRISFLSVSSDILFTDRWLMDADGGDSRWNDFGFPIVVAGDTLPDSLFSEEELSPFTEEEEKEFKQRTYRGTPYATIINTYLEKMGEPGDGEKHQFYNKMVKYFRVICDNDKRFLLWFLPRFGHSTSECWSQIKSICKVNTLSRIPREFYFFLKDNGFYDDRDISPMKKMMLSEDDIEDPFIYPPYLPPVFRELVGSAPKDFVESCVNALLPILGTLTSYLRATYPYDHREHSTSFFSVIYAPAGTGKSFVDQYMELLFCDLRLRDMITSERENIYLRALGKKGANEKSPDMPHVSNRIIPPKNSETEFLQKQKDNEGFHMFTFAAEMDSWAKGVRAAGGNKDDMIRIAWDNGEYGQSFKSANSFKGMVRLYWNVLITGTIAQLENYFKNVENGLVTRCSFTTIEHQEFSMPAVWKQLNKKELSNIKKFTDRCDRRTYKEPCDIDPFTLTEVSDEEFDKKINWRYQFRDKQQVDMGWLLPTIQAFHEEQVKKSALDVDRARDTFRRRVAVRGFRLGLLCYGLYENPRKCDLENCCKFVDWWMHRDLESSLKLWGAKYNSITDTSTPVMQRTVFDCLGESFTRNDVYAVCVKQGIKTPVRRILHEWHKLGTITKIDKDNFKKTKKK